MDFKINSSYTFNNRASAILGAGHKNAKLVAIFDSKLAASFINIQSTHANIFPYLPAGTPNSPEKYTYLLFEINGERKVIAQEWIDELSVVESSTQAIQIDIQNVTTQDVTKIRNMLTIGGFAATIKFL